MVCKYCNLECTSQIIPYYNSNYYCRTCKVDYYKSYHVIYGDKYIVYMSDVCKIVNNRTRTSIKLDHSTNITPFNINEKCRLYFAFS